MNENFVRVGHDYNNDDKQTEDHFKCIVSTRVGWNYSSIHAHADSFEQTCGSGKITSHSRIKRTRQVRGRQRANSPFTGRDKLDEKKKLKKNIKSIIYLIAAARWSFIDRRRQAKRGLQNVY